MDVDRADVENRPNPFEEQKETIVTSDRPGFRRNRKIILVGIAILFVGAAAGIFIGTDWIVGDRDEIDESGSSSPGTGQDGASEQGTDGSSTSDDSSAKTANQEDLPSSAPTSREDVLDWLVSPVTLSDGKMFQVVDEFFHDTSAFTQGLTFANGVLYESTGLYGSSSVRILDPDDGTVRQQIPMDAQYFAEGMTYYKGSLVQITWQAKKGFVYDPNDLSATPMEYDYRTTKNDEGWGITYDDDRDELVVTDGSQNLVFWDPNCWQTGLCEVKRSIAVQRLDGSPALRLNEIEYWRGRIIANIWLTNIVVVINHQTGMVEKEYDFTELFPQRNAGADVMNGISLSGHPDILYLTGKRWSKMFKVRLWA